jgi:hypothetical protein
MTIALYDMIGQKVATIAQSQYFAGQNEVTYDATGLTKGMYFVKITDGLNSSTLKMIVK